MPCADHARKPWAGSNRRAELPSNWTSTTARILRLDPECQLAYPGTWPTGSGMARCLGVSTEVDHIDDPLDHHPANLRSVCQPCHRRRTQQQANVTRQA